MAVNLDWDTAFISLQCSGRLFPGYRNSPDDWQWFDAFFLYYPDVMGAFERLDVDVTKWGHRTFLQTSLHPKFAQGFKSLKEIRGTGECGASVVHYGNRHLTPSKNTMENIWRFMQAYKRMDPDFMAPKITIGLRNGKILCFDGQWRQFLEDDN